LSNLSPENKKVISIKKINEIIEEKTESQPYIEENETTLQIKIDQLRQEIENLSSQKEKLLEDIRLAIENEKEAWEEQKEVERKEAQQVGYKVGFDEAYEKVFEQYDEHLNEANNIVTLAKEDYDKTISKHEQAIVNLAIAVAEKITIAKIEEDPAQFQQMVEQAILELKDSSNVEIFVHPSQYDFILNQKEELQQMVRDEDIISVYSDKTLDEYSCVIKHLYGQIDVSVDTQLKQLKRALEEKVLER